MPRETATATGAPRPGPLPAPPADLSTRSLPLQQARLSWVRCHRCDREPLYFGRSGDNRFDAPGNQYGVLYLGCDEQCALVETYGHATAINVVTLGALSRRCLARIEASRPLVLVDLTGPGLARLGADERRCAGEYAIAQRWAHALWAHPSQPDGLWYRSRHDPSRTCGAVFDRAAYILGTVASGRIVDPRNAMLLATILDAYGFGLIDAVV